MEELQSYFFPLKIKYTIYIFNLERGSLSIYCMQKNIYLIIEFYFGKYQQNDNELLFNVYFILVFYCTTMIFIIIYFHICML